MSKSVMFWVIMVVWLVFGLVSSNDRTWKGYTGIFVEFVLFALLGWQVFGAAVK